jgi:hypothetical protein
LVSLVLREKFPKFSFEEVVTAIVTIFPIKLYNPMVLNAVELGIIDIGNQKLNKIFKMKSEEYQPNPHARKALQLAANILQRFGTGEEFENTFPYSQIMNEFIRKIHPPTREGTKVLLVLNVDRNIDL